MRRWIAGVVATLLLVVAGVSIPLAAEAAPPGYQVGRQITMPSRGTGVAVDPARGLIYVTTRAANTVLVYDESTLTLVRTIPVPSEPYGITVGPTGVVYVSQYTGNALPGSVAVIPPGGSSVATSLPAGVAPVGTTVSSDGTRLWVASLGQLNVFDLTDPLAPVALAPVTGLGRAETVTESPDGSLLYVPNNGNAVYVIDTATNALETTWTGLGSAHQVTITTDGSLGMVSEQIRTTASVFSLATNTLTGSIPAANTYYQSQDAASGATFMTQPFGDGGGSVAIVDSATATLTQTLTGVTGAYWIATDPVTHRGYATSLTSNTLTEIRPSPPIITQNPSSVTVYDGQPASFTAAATGGLAPLTVQWQTSTDSGLTWSPIAGATSTTYAIPAVSLSQNFQYFRAVFTDALGSTATTTAASLLVLIVAPTVVTDPVDATVSVGDTATFSASASGSQPMTVRWQVSTDGGTSFADIPGATATTYSLTAAEADDGNQYRAVFSNQAGSATTAAATLTVLPLPPTAVTDPVDTTVDAGATATFTASASGTEPIAVRWQVSTDGGVTFTDIPGADATTLTLTAAQADDGNQYRAVFTNAGGEVTTEAATLTVLAPTTPTPTPTPTPPAPPGPPVDPPPADLAGTGSTLPVGLAAAAVALVLAGAAILGFRRRRSARR